MFGHKKQNFFTTKLLKYMETNELTTNKSRNRKMGKLQKRKQTLQILLLDQ